MFKTFSATPSDIQQDWYVIDAEDVILGRLATEVAEASTSRCSRRTWTRAMA